MLTNKSGYKGVEYTLTDLGNDRWGWAFYPQKDDGPAHRGETIGTREHVEMACMRAITPAMNRPIRMTREGRPMCGNKALHFAERCK